MHGAPALFDPGVPPPGQFAVTNAIENATTHLLPAGHFEYPGRDQDQSALASEVTRWFESNG